MTFEQLLKDHCGGDITAACNVLKSEKPTFSKPLSEVVDEYDPRNHKVMDIKHRPMKETRVQDGYDENGEPKYNIKHTEVCRVPVPVQRVLTERSVGFLFSTPADYSYEGKVSERAQELHNIVLRCLKDNKIKFFDKKLARGVSNGREAAELWYHLPDEKGKPSGDVRVMLLSPLKGDELLPMFDEYGRMVAFARAYYTKDYGKDTRIKRCDVYTSNYVYKYASDGGDVLTLVDARVHGFDRIPIVYYRQDETEWECVQPAIERMEDLLSNWGDTNDYFGSPSYLVKGALLGFAEKGEQGKIYQTDGEGDMSVLSWDSSPESMKGELANLVNIIFSYTQTPDVSFENMKTLGNNTSGVALQLMFTDPHMKAEMKIEMYGEAFTRRYNILKSVLATLNDISENVADELYVEPKFTPYIPQNTQEMLQMLTQCTNDPIMSQATAVSKNPLVDNPQDEMEAIVSETTAKSTRSLFEPTE